MAFKGNAFPDAAAKQAAKSPQVTNMLSKEESEERAPTTDDIAALQEAPKAKEKGKWRRAECHYDANSKLWLSAGRKGVVPWELLP